MRVHHPNAVRETADAVDDRVTLGGTTYALDADGTVDVPERAAAAWAESYGLSVGDIAVADEHAEGGDSGQEGDTCTAVKSDGEVCGRERPCQYHDDTDE